MLDKPRRLALLAEGLFTPLEAKTAVGVLRYRPQEVAAVVDSGHAGRDADACVGVGGKIPVVGSLEAAARLGADSLLIGVAPQGGGLPASWRATVEEAVGRGWDVISGLHEFLADDPVLTALARRSGATLHDVRRPPARRPVAARRAAGLEATVVLTVGSDCNVGKMTCALELVEGLRAAGCRAVFVATGQTGIMIADHGVAIDAVPADFVAGLIEEQVLEAARAAEVVVVEGQGALHHPGYSGVTLGLLHGCCPSAMVLCHQAGREQVRAPGKAAAADDPVIPPLDELVRVYESAAGWVHPARVLGIAVNTADLDENAARASLERTRHQTGLPTTDPVRFGVGPLVEAVEQARRRDRATLG